MLTGDSSKSVYTLLAHLSEFIVYFLLLSAMISIFTLSPLLLSILENKTPSEHGPCTHS